MTQTNLSMKLQHRFQYRAPRRPCRIRWVFHPFHHTPQWASISGLLPWVSRSGSHWYPSGSHCSHEDQSRHPIGSVLLVSMKTPCGNNEQKRGNANSELHITRLVSLHTLPGIHSVSTANHLDERVALVDIDNARLNHTIFVEQSAKMSFRGTASTLVLWRYGKKSFVRMI